MNSAGILEYRCWVADRVLANYWGRNATKAKLVERPEISAAAVSHPVAGLRYACLLASRVHRGNLHDSGQSPGRLLALLLGARTLLGAKGIATRSKDATRGSWKYY